ncbi:hypothetical protein HELRODRAFT_185038 [Helobdella robusta]|uniref:Sister chromatid cohesion protein DCC1 n=1 Tax=Helobdella robusta TaxID=6412 RepID=T1FMB4_HELRO|nr:hypothetical protein HELRODRAFT_185038 [Helobdella robusta]ESN98881.1 hypothetical protein HELRODRAFT_185038 [Helobdella robusta]
MSVRVIPHRSQEEIFELLNFAKIDKNYMKNYVQSFYFGENLHHEDVYLFEIDKSLLEDLKSSRSFVIRGGANDTAVLCTESKTFDLRESETSNSLLLFKGDLSKCPPPTALAAEGDFDTRSRKVETLKHNYYELKARRARLKRLKEKLDEHPYSACDTDQHDLYSFEDLLDEVQTSHKELEDGLKSLHACQIGGYWRLLDFEYLCSLFRSVLAIVDENGWSYHCIPSRQLEQALMELYKREITDHVMGLFTIEHDGKETCSLNELDTCRLYAEMILKTTAKFNLVEFCETWQLSVPDGMVTDLNQLKNLAVIDRDSKPEVIRYFPACDLPEDLQARFQVLFKTKEKWTFEEITPYLEDSCTGNTNVGNLLMKYARLSTSRGVKVYSSKRT